MIFFNICHSNLGKIGNGVLSVESAWQFFNRYGFENSPTGSEVYGTLYKFGNAYPDAIGNGDTYYLCILYGNRLFIGVQTNNVKSIEWTEK